MVWQQVERRMWVVNSLGLLAVGAHSLVAILSSMNIYEYMKLSLECLCPRNSFGRRCTTCPWLQKRIKF